MEGADSLPFIILRFKIRTKIFVFELERGPEYYTIEIHVDYDIMFCSIGRLL